MRSLPLFLCAAALIADFALAQESRSHPKLRRPALLPSPPPNSWLRARIPWRPRQATRFLPPAVSPRTPPSQCRWSLTLVEPQHSGLGGGAFVVYWDANLGALTTFDGRETAPAAATPDYWLGPDGEPVEFWDAVAGGRSVGVPGTLKVMETLHERYGRLAWADLFYPRSRRPTGFAVSQRLADAILEAQENRLDAFPTARDYFFRPDGTPRAEGNPAQPRSRRDPAPDRRRGRRAFLHRRACR